MEGRLLAAAVGAVLLLGTGCNGSESQSPPGSAPAAADTEDVETLLVATQQRASPDFQVGTASCPEQVPVRDGTTFNCTVVVEGVAAPYVVTLAGVNADSGTGRYDIRPAKAILSVPKLVDFVRGLATESNARADCGATKVRIADAGSTLDCQLIDSKGPHKVTLKVEDVNGKVTVVSVG